MKGCTVSIRQSHIHTEGHRENNSPQKYMCLYKIWLLIIHNYTTKDRWLQDEMYLLQKLTLILLEREDILVLQAAD